MVYADVGPVMLLSESSVKDLSSRLDEDVTVERFRPNIIISDCDAFEEVRCPAFTDKKHTCRSFSSHCLSHIDGEHNDLKINRPRVSLQPGRFWF